MKARLDHIGIAVTDLREALAFYRDALGLEVEAPEEVASQRVRAVPRTRSYSPPTRPGTGATGARRSSCSRARCLTPTGATTSAA